jgi:heterotetrameric sarcosine oxidase gamma subunit
MVTRQPVALSPLHHQHVELGAEMELSEGWQRPARYTSADDELEGLRAGVGICDVSPAGKLTVQGDGVDALLAAAFPDAGLLSVGQAARAGGDTALARLTHDEVWVTTAPNQAATMAQRLSRDAQGCVHTVDVTSARAAVRIVGPRSHMLLAAVTELAVAPSAFGDRRCAQSRFSEVHGTLVRLDTAELPDYTLYFGREYGDYMWESLLEAGERYHLTPFGTEALGKI